MTLKSKLFCQPPTLHHLASFWNRKLDLTHKSYATQRQICYKPTPEQPYDQQVKINLLFTYHNQNVNILLANLQIKADQPKEDS